MQNELLQNLKTHLQQLSNYQKVSTLIIAHDEWSIENKFLTLTMKIRHAAIPDKNGNRIEGWHEAEYQII